MSSFRTVLALDTAMSGCSVCVYNSDKDELVSKSKSMVRGQAEHLVPLVEEVMLDVGLDYQELDAVITTVGPGAFTGLRIGLSTARSLALALSIPIYGITTLQVLALEYVQRCDLKGQLVVLIETKRDDFYVQVFDKSGRPLKEASALLAEDIAGLLIDTEPVVFIGDAIGRFQDVLGEVAPEGIYEEGYDLPSSSVMSQALVKGVSGVILENTEPVYLRDADVSKSKKIQRVLVK